MIELIPALMFAGLFGLIFLGLPVAFALIIVAFAGALVIFPPLIASIQMYNILADVASAWLLTAVPPFVLMGYILEKSGIGELVFNAMKALLGRLPGGTALSVMGMAALFAATTGIVGAVEIMIGVLAIAPLMRQGYSKDLISGVICAGGSLGTMVPPTLVVVIYASVANLSIAQLYAAVLLPSVAMVAVFMGYIFARCVVTGEGSATDDEAPPPPSLAAALWLVTKGVLPVAFLILIVLGTVLAGLASPTEAASLGVVGAVVLALLNRRLTWTIFAMALRETLFVSCMVILIVIGGALFSAVFRLHGGQTQIAAFMEWLDPNVFGATMLMLAVVFILGFVFDWVSVVLITVPIFLPFLTAFSIDPLWFATLAVITLQTSYLTPPMAPSIFYLRSIAPPEIGYRDMYRGVLPFIACQILVLSLVFLFPALATWLPDLFR